MFLIVGLGNPGMAYRKSRHNAGFLAVDALAKAMHIRINKRAHKALLGEGFAGGEKVLLAKPQTYMNLSGEAVRAMVQYYKIKPQQLIVLYDDIDLPAGHIRIRANGSAGTHNGMRSIISCLGGEQGFSRVRIGVGRQQDERPLAAHVLAKPGKEEQARIDNAILQACDAVQMMVAGRLVDAQAKYNHKGSKGGEETTP
ncbi:aminoacyl-tRNA hydrolase [Christensenellaceae bacterium OttesenSCG-928-L17]|nr:aminoacyl-tRNA hydrolase [Christensenellaceae bacterium OttesenSCG-928-L17]